MYLYGRTQPLARYPIERCLETLACLGFDGVEVCLENEDIAPDLLTPSLIQRVRDTLRAVGLERYSISYHKDYIYDDRELARTIKTIEATPQFGSDIFVFAGTRARAERGDEAEWSRMIARTRELVRVAEANGVTLAEEFEPGFIVGCTADVLRLFDEIPSPNLAANLDLGHVFLCDPDPMAAIAQLGDRIVHVHIENMKAGVHNHLLPQDPNGDMALGDYVAALRQAGFDGGMALDLYNENYEEVAPETLAYLRGLLVG
jgi:sugar phosphate isomerase/epimerase